MFGALPYKYAFSPANHRWGLGSYDLMFNNKYALRNPHSYYADHPTQSSLYIFHTRSSSPNASKRSFALRRTLPTYNHTGNTTAFFPTIFFERSSREKRLFSLESFPQPSIPRFRRSVHIRKLHILDKWGGYISCPFSVHIQTS